MFLVLCLVSLFSVAFSSDVIDLTDDNFQSKVADKDLMLIEFFAPWCGHCKRLAPEYEKAATALKANDPPVLLAKVDCTESGKDTCGKYGVSGYPTLKIFRGGEFAEEYNGPRETGGIVKHMASKAGPSLKVITDVEEAEKFLASTASDYFVFGFFTEENALSKAFAKASDQLRSDFKFAHTTSEAVLKKFGQENKIVMYQAKHMQNKFEDKESVYSGEDKVADIKTWAKSKSVGLCPVRTADNMASFSNPLVVAYYDVDYVKNTKGTNYWRNRVMKVGKKLKDEGKNVNFAISNSNDLANELSEFGQDNPNVDKPIIGAKNAAGQKFVMAEEFSMDNLEKFVNDMLDGKLEPYMKSEPVPDNSNNAVKVVVAKNFDEIVNDESKDVLIEFYAPWCGHCKSLEPKYNELAETLKEETGITIAKMDATANDVPEPYSVSGFPTLYFAPKNSKKNPVKYDSGREVKDFIKYLAEKSTDEMEGYNRSGKKKGGKKSKVEL